MPALGNRLFDRAREALGCRTGQRRPIGNDDDLPACRTSGASSPAVPSGPRMTLSSADNGDAVDGASPALPSRCVTRLAVLPSSVTAVSSCEPSGAMSAANASAASKTGSRPKTRNSSPRRSASVGSGANTVRTMFGISGLSLVVEISLPSSRSTVKNPALPPSAASRTSSRVEAASGLAVGRSVSVTSRCLPAVPARSVARQTLGSPRTGSSSPGVRQFRREPSQPAKRSAPVNPDQRLGELA